MQAYKYLNIIMRYCSSHMLYLLTLVPLDHGPWAPCLVECHWHSKLIVTVTHVLAVYVRFASAFALTQAWHYNTQAHIAHTQSLVNTQRLQTVKLRELCTSISCLFSESFFHSEMAKVIISVCFRRGYFSFFEYTTERKKPLFTPGLFEPGVCEHFQSTNLLCSHPVCSNKQTH